MAAIAVSVSSDCRTAYGANGSGGSSANNSCGPEGQMDIETKLTRPCSSDRSDFESGIRAPCSSNGSGGEDDEAEAVDRERGAMGLNKQRALEGSGLVGGREQEVSVEIGETYLCQRADKTWRESSIIK